MKVPTPLFPQKRAFYRDTRGPPVTTTERGATVGFGGPTFWLEVFAPDVKAAAAYLETRGIARCDTVEPLPDGLDGMWISAPSGVAPPVRRETARP